MEAFLSPLYPHPGPLPKREREHGPPAYSKISKVTVSSSTSILPLAFSLC
jgi:hypothetical protein